MVVSLRVRLVAVCRNLIPTSRAALICLSCLRGNPSLSPLNSFLPFRSVDNDAIVFSSAQISILGPTSWFSYRGIGAAQLPLALV
jgi:hypothetical protein